MKKEQSEPFNYEQAKQKVKEQLRSGKSLFGKEGAFAPLLQEMLNSILEGEMEGHLDEEERDSGNRKNGKNKKFLKTSSILGTPLNPDSCKPSLPYLSYNSRFC